MLNKIIVNPAKSYARRHANKFRKIRGVFSNNGLVRACDKKKPALTEKISLVVPTYNVEKYFDEFMWSVVSQSTGLHNVEIIVVDDGSPDTSGDIAKKWQAKYPNTIKYIYQDNKGLSGARNTGMDHATGDWISFPDPDDMLDRNYLHCINQTWQRNRMRPLAIIGCHLIQYYEEDGTYRDSHPLSYKFKRSRTVRPANDLGNFIHMQVASTIVNFSLLKESGFRFNKDIKPTFEDGYLLNRLLVYAHEYNAEFISDAHYFYRKRSDESSLVGGAHTKREYYTDQLRYGYLDLLEKAKNENGNPPKFIQRTVLYDLGWRFRRLLNHPERIAHLCAEDRSEFLTLLDQIFAYIAPETIREMRHGALTEEHRVALLAMYKGEKWASDFVYVSDYDPVDRTMQFASYTGGHSPHEVLIFVDGQIAEQRDESCRINRLLDRPYYSEHRFWASVPEHSELRATIGGRPARLKRGGATLGDRVRGSAAIRGMRIPAAADHKLPDEARRLRSFATSGEIRARYADCWVLMDRDDAADDNAEHLYRYLMQIGKAANAFFILRPETRDWQRLKDEGFQLLPFGSDDHVAAIVNASLLISSHADHFILWPVTKSWIHDLTHYRYAFLQHGVTKDDLSNWLNAKPISLFVTCAKPEWHSIADPESNYLFSQKETKLTGFPRHDALLAREHKQETILIMPTWRRYLVGETADLGMKREPMDDFMESGYAREWKALLLSDELRLLAERHSKKITFCPHPNMAMYVDEFDLPEYIQRRDPRIFPSLQETFAEAAIVVTDYSSIAFDCAYIDKPIVYHQFDREEFFAGDHVYTRGYFDYGKDGFGPVTEALSEVIAAISRALEGKEELEYADRRKAFFAFRDGKSCERVYDAMLKLVQPMGEEGRDQDLFPSLLRGEGETPSSTKGDLKASLAGAG
ncbi:MAG TPA: CDP-glycerol glycerophosphotransferase family protein [Sphingobium sp.]|nr:CDP-glycerol glycerophosphotransferase family protein [Sphingobium sp.]